MLISIVVPAFNEERYLGKTLARLQVAKTLLESKTNTRTETIVVDNESNDSTPDIARALGSTVISERQHKVARVRNTGARFSNGDVLVFVDADTLVPDNLLDRIAEVMSDESCLGGAVDTHYQPSKPLARGYLQLWRLIGKFTGMAQGATQFCRRDVFFKLDGYDETLFMGEDVDMYWRLKRFAKRNTGSVAFLDDIRVEPSTRRFDQWHLWRTLLWTNPFFILLFRRRSSFWRGWYSTVPR
jgi:glycosyltransferase involved in cell wall biosynthesis